MQELPALVLRHYTRILSLADEALERYPNRKSRDELINAGLVGLLEAFDRYNSGHGVRFTEYLRVRVMDAIIDALKLHPPNRKVARRVQRWELVYAQLQEDLGRIPTGEEMAQILGVDPDAYQLLLEEIRPYLPLDNS